MASRRSVRVVIGERLLSMILEGRVKVARGKKLKYGRYKIVTRRRGSGGLGCQG